MVWTITIAINSSANFRIYYYRAKTFKDGAKFIFDKLIGKVKGHQNHIFWRWCLQVIRKFKK